MLLSLGLLISSLSHAQEPKDHLTLSYAFQHSSIGSGGVSAGTNVPAGFDFSNTVTVHKWLGIEGDMSLGHKDISGVSVWNLYGLGGPRIAQTFGRVTPYGHFLLGVEHLKGSYAGLGGSTNAFAFGGGGGATFWASKRVGFTGGLDYLHASKYGVGLGTIRVLGGVSFRFGTTGIQF
jgi:hypothetical protein